MRTLLATSLLVALSATSLSAAVSARDHKLMIKLGVGDASEVELARRVKPHASSPEVRDLANQMVTDHAAAFARLKKIASRSGVTLSSAMDSEHREFATQLAKRKHGPSYDRTYVEQMVKDHEKDSEEVTKALAEIKNPEFRKWAEDELKLVEGHLAHARMLSAKK